jgi:hypothetical protein
MIDTSEIQPASFIESSRFRRIHTTFWVVYFLFPLLTGLFWYKWQPNEAFDPRIHTVIEAHQECTNSGQCGDVMDAWQDKRTHRIFTREQFARHREAEAMRLGISMFGYGLIGCFVFAYVEYLRSKKLSNTFYAEFGKAVCLNLAIAGFGFLHLYFE